MRKQYLIFLLILFSIFIFRLPSLFEPFWYGDEGIFAAVANNLNQGGMLYRDSWDNKPPMIYLTYAAIFKTFGVSMFWLRLVTVIFVLSTCAVIYEIAQKALGGRKALVATFIFGFLTSLRIIEGNLALTEIFMILPISLAMLISIKALPAGRQGNFDYISLFSAGVLFALASLYKQVGGLEAAAFGIYLFLISKNFVGFVKNGAVLSLGFIIPYLIFVLYFAPKGLLDDYIFAAYTYYRIYLGESPQYAFLINILKFLPIVAAILWGLFRKFKKEVNLLNLFLLWAAFSFLGSFFSGRTYGHYLVQAVPASSLVLAAVNLKFRRSILVFSIFFFVPLVVLTKILFTDFLSSGPLSQLDYWGNFIDFSMGRKSLDSYNDYFDHNVNSIMTIADFFASRGEDQPTAYIWGDYPWLYAIADIKNPSRYVTSFHVFGVPRGRGEVARAIVQNPPKYIIKPANSIGYFAELEKLITAGWKKFARVDNSDIYIRREL